MSEPRVRLRPGIRVSDRSDTTLQVGLHPGHRLVLPDDPTVRGSLALLGNGVEPRRLDPDLLRRLSEAGLLAGDEDGHARSRARRQAAVEVHAASTERATLLRMLGEAGVHEASGAAAVLSVLVTIGAEPRRETVDTLVSADRAHLLVTGVAGRLRIGPFVVPGLTACLRCLDAHLTDHDPRHPLVVEQHLVPDPADRPDPADLQLALAWAARDVVALICGDRPSTWSTTIDLEPGGPLSQRWRRHPGCGCAWGDALAG